VRDSITDMQWKAMPIPGVDPNIEWYGHEGFVQSAIYIKQELESKRLIEKALNYDLVIKNVFFILFFNFFNIENFILKEK
jgi:hypothetical protein